MAAELFEAHLAVLVAVSLIEDREHRLSGKGELLIWVTLMKYSAHESLEGQED